MTAMIARASMLAAALVLAGGAVNAANAQSAPAPAMKVGDRWVYNVKSGVGLRPTNYQETREVTAVGGGGIQAHGHRKDRRTGKDFTRVDEYSGPGALRSGAPCADEAYRFPDAAAAGHVPGRSGQRASKWIDVINEPGGGKGQINYGFRTRSWDKQTVPAGTFDAIRIDTTMVLDDSTPFRYATNCNFSYWYSPAVRARCASTAGRSTCRSATSRAGCPC